MTIAAILLITILAGLVGNLIHSLISDWRANRTNEALRWIDRALGRL